jgi:hypothetical protein
MGPETTLDLFQKEVCISFISIIESTYLAITREIPIVKKMSAVCSAGTARTRMASYTRLFLAE